MSKPTPDDLRNLGTDLAVIETGYRDVLIYDERIRMAFEQLELAIKHCYLRMIEDEKRRKL